MGPGGPGVGPGGPGGPANTPRRHGRLSLFPDEIDAIQAACKAEPTLPTGAGYDGLLHTCTRRWRTTRAPSPSIC